MTMTMAMVNRNNDDRVLEWVEGLPSQEELTPLSESLISPELAFAFRISLEPSHTLADVHRASQSSFALLSGSAGQALVADSITDGIRNGNPNPNSNPNPNLNPRLDPKRPCEVEEELEEEEGEGGEEGEGEGEGEGGGGENSNEHESARTLKRPRLVWTPQLHKRFVEAVAHLGIKSAVPKTIMQLMNVDGLTRENVASHLQKYRIYLKRMSSGSLASSSSSTSDHLFASTPTHFLTHPTTPHHREDLLVPMPYVPMPIPLHHPPPVHLNTTNAPFLGYDPRLYRPAPTANHPPPHHPIQPASGDHGGYPRGPSLALFPNGIQ